MPSIKMPNIVPKLSPGYICTSWGRVTWLFLLGNRCSNHYDVTVRCVTLNSNRTLNRIGNKISIAIPILRIIYSIEDNLLENIYKKQLSNPGIHILICLFFHFDFQDAIKYTSILSKFLHFY